MEGAILFEDINNLMVVVKMPDVGLDFGSKVQSRTRSLDPS